MLLAAESRVEAAGFPLPGIYVATVVARRESDMEPVADAFGRAFVVPPGQGKAVDSGFRLALPPGRYYLEVALRNLQHPGPEFPMRRHIGPDTPGEVREQMERMDVADPLHDLGNRAAWVGFHAVVTE